MKSPSSVTAARCGSFATTHWSLVLAAKDGESPQAHRALEELCRTYWHPIYVFLRREGHGATDAEDLAQAFFVHLLQRDFLTHLRHRRGKFRSFLLAFLKHFLNDERDRARALKRGGGRPVISWDSLEPEARHALEPVEHLSPDEAYERHWARMVLEHALRQLREEYTEAGKASLFDQLKDFQPGEHGPVTYAEMGARLGLSEGGVKSAVHRLRKRHREILREEVAQTVTRPQEVDEEIRHLLRVLGG